MEVIQARVDAIRWYHEFDFGNGLKARSKEVDIEARRHGWRFIEKQLDGIDFRGKSVLDVGCWDGYWSFYAERRGARSVLAVDDFSQNWSDANGLLLARDLLKSRVQINTRLSVYDLASLGQRFDIVLLLGVYYHLLDPFHAFAQVRQCCHPGAVVCIEGTEGVGLPPNAAVLTPEMGTSNKFLPSIGYLRQLLRAAYLSVESEQFLMDLTPPPGRLGWRWRLRMCWQALRGSRAGVMEVMGPISQPRTDGQRVFLLCAPTEGVNPVHKYRPPFGLHAFDARFRGEGNPGNALDRLQTR